MIDYLAKNYHVDVSKVSPSMDLVKEGILDSGGVIEFVMFVEQAFSTQIADEDVTIENFGSVARTLEFIDRTSRKS
ncbi:MAG: acyl carrier protein [Fimbriimonadaceae bacterium]|nr:acyl carrier protein [Alphaproteobacteria bacterium]